MTTLGSFRFNSRQQRVLSLLLQAPSSMTLKDISGMLDISVRTVQRELSELEPILTLFRLQLIKKSGVGIFVEGSGEDKRHLLDRLTVPESMNTYSPEERQCVLKYELLGIREPVKLFYFSDKLNVAEATISNDLLKIEPWFRKHGLNLVRKPGFGVNVEGSERQVRQAMIDLLYSQFSYEQIMDNFLAETGEIALHPILMFVEAASVPAIQRAVHRMVARRIVRMSDTAHIGLIVHISLALHRLRHGEAVELDRAQMSEFESSKRFQLIREIVAELGRELGVAIPDGEVFYIAMHVLGAEMIQSTLEPPRESIEAFADRMTRIVEKELKLSLESDVLLLRNLVLHLSTALHRIKLRLQIRNPLLQHIKEAYPDIFKAAAAAARYLESEIGRPVPVEEVGYLAMHYGAAVELIGQSASHKYKALIVCTGGLGTSRLLAAEIEKKLPHIRTVDSIALHHLEEWFQRGERVDLIISTIPFPPTTREWLRVPVVTVSSFLLQEEMNRIQAALNGIDGQLGEDRAEERKQVENIVARIDRYRSALGHLAENIYAEEGVAVRSKQEVIAYTGRYARMAFGIEDERQLAGDLEAREQLGAWVFPEAGISILHCRSSVIKQQYTIVFRLNGSVDWGTAQAPIPVGSVLIMLIPENALKEQLEMMGEISAATTNASFLQAIADAPCAALKQEIVHVLEKGFIRRISHLTR